MKLLLLVLGFCCLSAALLARDLPSLARREKARRRALASQTTPPEPRAFDDDDLERYRRTRGAPGPDVVRRPGTVPVEPTRDLADLAKEKKHWQEAAARHERELARLDASIRKLEWRLVERRNRRKSGERLSDDPTGDMIEDSIENLREQRRILDERFRERARRAGAFPGWLR